MTQIQTTGGLVVKGRLKWHDVPFVLTANKCRDDGLHLGIHSTEGVKMAQWVLLTPEFCKAWLPEIKLCASRASGGNAHG